ncbi:MAG: hypothetical protein Q9159_004909 [Coniocarpon cinnabarinum]
MESAHHHALNPSAVPPSANVFDRAQDETFLEAWASGKSVASDDPRQNIHLSQAAMQSHDPSPTYTEPREQPPWADMKTKAGKDRKRLPLACIACRRKKIKCSGEKPSCQHCAKSRVPCVYKVTQRRATPRTDYMGMLDKRLKRMEDRVLKIVPKSEVENVPRAVLKPAAVSAQAKNASNRKRVVDEAFGHDLDGWAAEEGQKTDAYRTPKTGSGDERRTATDGADSLPSKDMQMHLAEVFFEYIYGQSYFLLHKGRYMLDLKAGTVPPYLNLAVCAVSARFSTHPDLQTDPPFLRGEQWSKPSQEIALSVFDTPNINTLIVLVLLCLHGFGCCQGGRAWMLSGMAHRMSYALRLHKDPEYDGLGSEQGARLSFVDREIRRRAMWACFCLDRFTSSGTERPMFAGERYMQLHLPVRESMYRNEIAGPTEGLDPPEKLVHGKIQDGVMTDPKKNMGIAAYVIRVIALWGRINDYMNQGGRLRGDDHPPWSPRSKWNNLREQCDNFLSTLPPRLQYTQENLKTFASEGVANAFLLLHVGFHQSVIFLHRFAFPNIAVFNQEKGEPEGFNLSGRQRAQESANNLSDILSEALKYRMVFPFAGYAAYVSSAVQLYDAFNKNEDIARVSKARLTSNIQYLSRMKKHWGMLHFLTENLKDLYRQHADAAARGVPVEPENGSRRGVFQYADWHERFPRGVSGDGLEPIQVQNKGKGMGGKKASDLQSVDEYMASKGKSSKHSAPPHKSARKEAQRNNSASRHANHPPTHPGVHTALSDRTRSPRGSEAAETSPASFGVPEGYDRMQPHPHLQAQSTPSSAYGMEIPQQLPPHMRMPQPSFSSNGSPQDLSHPIAAYPNTMMNMDVDWAHGAAYADDFLTHNGNTHVWNTNFSLNMPMPMDQGFFFQSPEVHPQQQQQPGWIPAMESAAEDIPPDTKPPPG